MTMEVIGTLEKALVPMEVSSEGSSISVMPLQPLKVFAPSFVNLELFANVIFDSFAQPQKLPVSSSTADGIVICQSCWNSFEKRLV